MNNSCGCQLCVWSLRKSDFKETQNGGVKPFFLTEAINLAMNCCRFEKMVITQRLFLCADNGVTRRD
jgi:hypothetical protein